MSEHDDYFEVVNPEAKPDGSQATPAPDPFTFLPPAPVPPPPAVSSPLSSSPPAWASAPPPPMEGTVPPPYVAPSWQSAPPPVPRPEPEPQWPAEPQTPSAQAPYVPAQAAPAQSAPPQSAPPQPAPAQSWGSRADNDGTWDLDATPPQFVQSPTPPNPPAPPVPPVPPTSPAPPVPPTPRADPGFESIFFPPIDDVIVSAPPAPVSEAAVVEAPALVEPSRAEPAPFGAGQLFEPIRFVDPPQAFDPPLATAPPRATMPPNASVPLSTVSAPTVSGPTQSAPISPFADLRPQTPAPRAQSDGFDFLLSAGGDAVSSETAPVRALNLEVRPRAERRPGTSPLDIAALVFAIIGPPIGIIVGVLAMRSSSSRNGWASGVSRAATWIASILTVVLIAGGVVFSNVARVTAEHDAIVVSGAQFCSAITADPNTLASGTFGWPAVQGSIADSIVSMKQFESFWQGLSASAPVSIRPEVDKVVKLGQEIITSVDSSRILDDASNVSAMQQLATASKIPQWMAEYCK